MAPRHIISILVIMALFGSSYPIGKLGVSHFPAFQFAALRSLLLLMALLPLWRLATPAKDRRKPLAGFCLSMGLGVYATMYLALEMADTVSPIIIGTQLSVPFAVLLGSLFLGERVRPITWAAIAAAFSGVVIIAFEPALIHDLPALAVIGVSAVFYAIATQFARSLRDLPVSMLNGWMALVAIPPLALMSLLIESGQWEAVTTAGILDWAVLAHSAIAISLIAHLWMFSLYRHYPVSWVIPWYVMMPVFGVGFALLIFTEVPSLQTLIGGAIVIAATWAVNRTTSGPTRTVAAAPEPPPPANRAPPQAADRSGSAHPIRHDN